MQVTIAEIELTGGMWGRVWADGVRTYTYQARAEPLKLVDGKHAPLDDAESALLELQGYDGELSIVIAHDDDASGGSPSATTIGTEQLQSISTAFASVVAAWKGKTVTSGVS